MALPIFRFMKGVIGVDEQYTQLVVGREFPLGDTRGKEGFFVEYSEDKMLYMVVCFPNMTEKEINAISDGNGRMGIFMYDNVIYFVTKFEGLDGDSAYSVYKYDNPEAIDIDMPEEGKGIALHIFAVDSRNNILKGMRICGMGNRWTRALKKAIELQKETSMDMEEFFGKVAIAHQRWTSKEMMRMAHVSYKLGSPLEEVK